MILNALHVTTENVRRLTDMVTRVQRLHMCTLHDNQLMCSSPDHGDPDLGGGSAWPCLTLKALDGTQD